MASRTGPQYPSYCRQKFKKQRGKPKRAALAYVDLPTGNAAKPYKRVYLGPFEAEESRAKYDATIGEWLANNRTVADKDAKERQQLTVAGVAAEYLKWVSREYRRQDGTEKSTVQDTRDAFKPLVALFGATPATEFSPKKLLAVRQRMVDMNTLCRKTINERIGIIKRAFRKAVEFELLADASVADRLDKVEGIRQGRGEVRESRDVQPVPRRQVRAVRRLLSRQVRAIADLQLITGARPSELLVLRPIDLELDESGIWYYRPTHHKTAHHGKKRVLRFGPRAQRLLQMFMSGRPVNLPVFSPKEAERERLAALHAKRKTPLSCGNKPGTNVAESPQRFPGDQYDEASYRRAITRACDAANPLPQHLALLEQAVVEWRKTHPAPAEIRRHVGKLRDWRKANPLPPNLQDVEKEVLSWRQQHRWHPYRLRHNAATMTERRHGEQAAAALLGHALGSNITKRYIAPNDKLADDVARKCG